MHFLTKIHINLSRIYLITIWRGICTTRWMRVREELVDRKLCSQWSPCEKGTLICRHDSSGPLPLPKIFNSGPIGQKQETRKKPASEFIFLLNTIKWIDFKFNHNFINNFFFISQLNGSKHASDPIQMKISVLNIFLRGCFLLWPKEYLKLVWKNSNLSTLIQFQFRKEAET